MGTKPPGTLLERKDNNGDYSPENCKWETRIGQNNNKRNNHVVEFNGVKHTIAEWARITGINDRTIWQRLNRCWPIERALTWPKQLRVK